jgi:uncharacterized cofD-like protein
VTGSHAEGGSHLHLVAEPTGPRVVAIGGGHGLAASLRAARTYASEITAVVSVADDGGSTGRLRAASERPAPGDLRKCLVALSDESSLLSRAFEHRYDAGELAGHAFGNLMIVALAETGGDLVAALDELGRVLQTAGRVLPTTTESVSLQGCERSGEIIEGQVAVGASDELSTVRLVPDHAPACAEAVRAIGVADQIVLGPGSLFTSVLAATAVDGIRSAVVESSAQFVYVCNLQPQLPETSGYGVAEHVAALERHGLVPDVVLYDPDAIGDAGEVGAAVPGLLARPNGLAHDPVLLGKALESIAPC